MRINRPCHAFLMSPSLFFPFSPSSFSYFLPLALFVFLSPSAFLFPSPTLTLFLFLPLHTLFLLLNSFLLSLPLCFLYSISFARPSPSPLSLLPPLTPILLPLSPLHHPPLSLSLLLIPTFPFLRHLCSLPLPSTPCTKHPSS